MMSTNLRQGFLAATLLWTCNHGLWSQATAIVLDGLFDDWANVPSWTDGVDPEAAVDLLEMKAAHDNEFLYVYVRLSTDINLSSSLIPHNLFLQIDTDMDASTGFAAQAGFGSELGIKFKDRFAYYNVQPDTLADFYALGLNVAPTVTSSEFELAIRRDVVPDGIHPLFPQSTIRLLFREVVSGDFIPDDGITFEFTFSEEFVPPVAPISIAHPNLPSVRTCAYNVLAGGLVAPDRQPHLKRVVQAIDADVYFFSECLYDEETDIQALLDAWLPTPETGGWHVHKHEDMMTASRWAHLQTWDTLASNSPVLVNVPASLGGPMLFVNSHLYCCANNDARQDQVDAFMAWWLEASGGEIAMNTPVIYGGDLNLVGFAEQLTTLLEGEIVQTDEFGPGAPPDWDGTFWTDVQPRHTHAPTTHTWRTYAGYSYPPPTFPPGYFPPGRLDYLIYSDATLTVENDFVLRTEALPQEVLEAYELESADTETGADHFPVVADFMSIALAQTDDDNDGLNYAEEFALGTDPLSADSDGDGLTDLFETTYSNTDPTLMDSNFNGCDDGQECIGLCGCIADLDNDQNIGVGDLLLLLTQFGASCAD